MNIYEFSYSGGETDWVFAPDIQEAKDFYLKFTGCGDLTLTKVKEATGASLTLTAFSVPKPFTRNPQSSSEFVLKSLNNSLEIIKFDPSDPSPLSQETDV